MKNQLTEKVLGTITDVKRNHSIHSEYYEANDPIAGAKGKGDEDILAGLTLDNIKMATDNPDLLKEQTDRDAATTARLAAEAAALELEKNKGAEETAEAKATREAAEAAEAAANEVVIDAEGNQVDATGNIIKTKDVLAEEQRLIDEANVVPLIDEIINTSGVTILGEDGKPVVYEDSIEGIIKYNNDLAKFKANQEQEEFFKAYPKAKKYFEAQIKGIPDNEFFGNQLADWKTVSIDETNLEQQFDVIVKDLEAKGFSKERAIKSATRTKDSGKDVLLEESKLSLESLQSNQIANEKAVAAKEAETERIATERRDTYWGKVNEVITTGKLGEYLIPEAERKAFYNYVGLDADGNGNSAAVIARSKRTLEQSLLMDYYSFKGMKFDSLVKNAVQGAKVNGLRERVLRANTKGVAQDFNKDNSINLNDLTLKNVST